MAKYSELVTAQKNYGELKKSLTAIKDLKSLKFMMEIAGDDLYNCRVEFISLWAKAAAIIQNGFGKPPGTLVDDIASMFYLLAKANVEPCLPSKKKNTATASTAVAVVDAVVCVAVNSDVIDRDAAVNNTAGASTAVAVDDEPVGSACEAVVDAVVRVAVNSDVEDTAAAVDNIATAGVAVAVTDDNVVCVAVNPDYIEDSAVAVDNIATAGVAVVVHNADVGCVVTNSHDVGDSAAAVPDDDVHVPAVAAVVRVAANSSVEVVAVDADADSIAVNTEVVAVADNIEVGSVDNHCRRGFQLLKMVGGSGAALRAGSTAEKIIEYFSCAIKLVPCDNGRRHFVFDTGWSF